MARVGLSASKLCLVSGPSAVGQNFSGSPLPPKFAPACTTPLSFTTMMTNGERMADWAAAFRGMKASSRGRPNISPPAPWSTNRRFILRKREASLFMVGSNQGRRLRNASLVTSASSRSRREIIPARETLA